MHQVALVLVLVAATLMALKSNALRCYDGRHAVCGAKFFTEVCSPTVKIDFISSIELLQTAQAAASVR